MLDNINLIEEKKKVEKILTSLNDELEQLGYLNPHKLQKSYKFKSNISYEQLFIEVKKKKHKISRVHNDNYGIKTTIPTKTLISIMKKYQSNSFLRMSFLNLAVESCILNFKGTLFTDLTPSTSDFKV